MEEAWAEDEVEKACLVAEAMEVAGRERVAMEVAAMVVEATVGVTTATAAMVAVERVAVAREVYVAERGAKEAMAEYNPLGTAPPWQSNTHGPPDQQQMNARPAAP